MKKVLFRRPGEGVSLSLKEKSTSEYFRGHKQGKRSLNPIDRKKRKKLKADAPVEQEEDSLKKKNPYEQIKMRMSQVRYRNVFNKRKETTKGVLGNRNARKTLRPSARGRNKIVMRRMPRNLKMKNLRNRHKKGLSKTRADESKRTERRLKRKREALGN